ncbi:hypothetical protein LshimejAT787_0704190 [Lyophyllum shimeji]|uniref:Uncharacterized protein n=1 Tax=Lyophyllum shimeji TaxID=47721 RepID=A0A9P3UM11_LYOSH|nr:hypothetical protein LshimejAT787_0704190 [Lyophyllum shimeji]
MPFHAPLRSGMLRHQNAVVRQVCGFDRLPPGEVGTQFSFTPVAKSGDGQDFLDIPAHSSSRSGSAVRIGRNRGCRTKACLQVRGLLSIAHDADPPKLSADRIFKRQTQDMVDIRRVTTR